MQKLNELQLRRMVRVLMERRNDPPPKTSNWWRFAQELDIGVLDLDDIAYDLGFTDFHDMDLSITPSTLSKRDPQAFLDAVKNIVYSEDGDWWTQDFILSAAGDDLEEVSMVAGIAGATTPLGTGPAYPADVKKRTKKKQKTK